MTKKYIEKQRRVGKNLFPINNEDALTSFTEVIDLFINDNDDYLNNRLILHKEVKKYIDNLVSCINSLEIAKNELMAKNQSLQKQTNDLKVITNNINDEKEELINDNKKLNDDNKLLIKQIDSFNETNSLLKNQLNEYRNGKLYNVATKIYSIKSKITKKN